KPVGLVWFGLASPEVVRVERRVFAAGGRAFVRMRAAETALALLLTALGGAVED
ncbi:MAG: CinA family protein, partial [Parvularculaceae bacterium]|nr:CinA family protein [Parvularculaceae bacterium]